MIDQGLETEKVIAPEHFPHDAVVAFVYVQNRSLAERVAIFLKSRGIFISEAKNISEGLDKIRINYYNILVVEDTESTKSLLDVVKKWNGLRRREVNVILVDSKAQSLHANESFFKGVNSVISSKDNERVEYILELAIGEYTKYIEPWNYASEKLRLKG